MSTELTTHFETEPGLTPFGQRTMKGVRDAVVADGGLAAREGAAVVGHEEDDGVVGHALVFEEVHDAADVFVESADFVVVHGEVAADVGHVGKKWRHHDILSGVRLIDGVFLVGAVGIGCCQPEEKRFLFGAVFNGGQPMAVSGGVAAFFDDVELVLDVGAEVPFAEGCRVVAGFFEGLGEECLVTGEGARWSSPAPVEWG